MRARLTCAGVVLLATIVVLGSVLTGQSPPPRQQLLVTSDASGRVIAWRASASGYEKAWESTARLADANVKTAGNVFPSVTTSIATADVDGDGANEVVALDSYGVTVYGAKPAYMKFDEATEPSSPALAVGDVDGDGTPEIVTQRTVGSGADIARQISFFKVTAAGVSAVGQQKVPSYGNSIAVGDVDNDKQNEILSGGSEGIAILERRTGNSWEQAAAIPILGGAGTIVIADVDKDNKNEIVCGGAGINGKVAVYKYRKVGDRATWPVLWQSRVLMTEGLTQGKNTGRPYSIVLDVAAADVDGDGQKEVLAASTEYGKLGEEELISSGRLHLFKFDGQSEFTMDWVSDRARLAYGSGIIGTGDLDGDGATEISYYGRTVYKRNAGGKGFTAVATGCSNCTASAIGALGELREPAAAARVVPVAWTVGGDRWPGQMVEGQAVDVALTVRNVWAEASNVNVKLSSTDAGLQVTTPSAATASIPAGGTATLRGLRLKGVKSGTYAVVNIEIAIGDIYRQTIPARVLVTAPLPTYKPVTDGAVTEALQKARDDNQRVLIMWGSNADKTAQAFLESSVKNAELSHELSYEYQVVRADVAGGQKVASKYGATFKHGALPHLTVLSADGKVLLNEPVATVKPAQPVLAGATAPPPFDVKKVVETLKKFDAPPQDARQVLQAALNRARTESKTVFIWFSAPW